MIVGAGLAAGRHLDALSGLPEAEIAGIVDIDSARASATAKQASGLAWATDLDEAAAAWEFDAAVVCAPNDTHLDIGTRLADHGVHTLMEKPLAVDPSQTAQLVEAFRSEIWSFPWPTPIASAHMPGRSRRRSPAATSAGPFMSASRRSMAGSGRTGEDGS